MHLIITKREFVSLNSLLTYSLHILPRDARVILKKALTTDVITKLANTEHDIVIDKNNGVVITANEHTIIVDITEEVFVYKANNYQRVLYAITPFVREVVPNILTLIKTIDELLTFSTQFNKIKKSIAIINGFKE